MVKTNRRRAVTDRAQDRDFPARLEFRLERQRPNPISVGGHAGRFTAVAAENQSTQFARLLPAGVVSLAPAEIELRPRVRAHIAATVVEGIPFRVVTEIEADAVDRHVVEPDFAGAIPGLQYGQEAEMGDGESFTEPVFRHNLTTRGFVVQVEGQQTLAARAIWIIDHLPTMHFAGRNFDGRNPLALDDLADDTRGGPPTTGAIFEMTMKRIAAVVDAGDQRVRRAPFIERVGVEKSQQTMSAATRHKQTPFGCHR